MQSDCLNVTPPTTSLVPSENEHKPANRMVLPETRPSLQSVTDYIQEVTTGAGSSADMWGSPVTTFDPILFPGDVFGQGLCFYGERVRLLPISASHQKSGDDLDAPSIKFEIAKALGTGSYTVVYQVRQVLSNYPVPPEDPWLISAVDFDYVPSSPSPVRYGQEYALKCMSKADLDKDALSAQMLEVCGLHFRHELFNLTVVPRPRFTTLFLPTRTSSPSIVSLKHLPISCCYSNTFLARTSSIFWSNRATDTNPNPLPTLPPSKPIPRLPRAFCLVLARTNYFHALAYASSLPCSLRCARVSLLAMR